MKKHTKEIIKLTAREVLLSMFDLAIPFFEADRIYRIPARKYRQQRQFEHNNFPERIKYLRRQGLISTFVEDKERFLEITPKGLEKINLLKAEPNEIERSKVWDGKWRVVIFDVPDKHRIERDIFRHKIKKIGLIPIQESVYVYPFECTKEITLFASHLNLSRHILIMISEIIQGEENIIDHFLQQGILTKSDLKKV